MLHEILFRLDSKMSEESDVPTMKLHQEFNLGENLGQGGFGQIIKATRKSDENEYAIKIIKFDSNIEDAGKYKREAENLSRLCHTNIVRYYNSWIETARIPLSEYNSFNSEEHSLSWEIHKLSRNGYMSNEWVTDESNDYDEDDAVDEISEKDTDLSVSFQLDSKDLKFLFIQMELCEKYTLRTAIDNNLYLDETKLSKYFREICEGLLHIHQKGIVHRDLKPENIFLTSANVIKIGDFGLSKQIVLVNEFENLTSNNLPFGSLTGTCGTNIYIAPELHTGKIFNAKADIYSLGVTYFEMCSPSMTQMEKAHEFPISEKRFKKMVFQTSSSKKKFLIKNMLSLNYNDRPTCEEIIKILNSEKSLEEIKKIMQQNKKIPAPQLKAFVKILKGNTIEKGDLTASFIKKAVEIFEIHGGHNIALPTFLPSFNNYCDNLTTMLNIQGNSVCVSNTSRIAFSNYLKRNELNSFRRYSVGRIFEEGYFLPTETQECVFEAITPEPDHVTDAEILYIAKEICDKVFPQLGDDIRFCINHRLIFSTVLRDSGITEKDAALFTNAMVKCSKKIMNAKEFQKPELKVEVKDLFKRPWTSYNINNAEAKLSEELNNAYGTIKKAFKELKMIVKHMNEFGIQSKNIILEPLLITEKNSSGFMFRVILTNPEVVLATGDKFDSLINRYDKNKKNKPRLSAIGISFLVDNMINLLNSSVTDERFEDVLIYTRNNNKAEAIPLLKKLWSMSIKTRFTTEIELCNNPRTIFIHLLEGRDCTVLVLRKLPTLSTSWVETQIFSGDWRTKAFFNTMQRHLGVVNQLVS